MWISVVRREGQLESLPWKGGVSREELLQRTAHLDEMKFPSLLLRFVAWSVYHMSAWNSVWVFVQFESNFECLV